MAKRRQEEDSDIDVSSTDSESETEQVDVGGSVANAEGEAPGEELVNVDFDYFDFNPEIDFHSIKTLVRQLFGDDHSKFDVSSLADVILSKNAIGTTIKTEGINGDPFAMLTTIPMAITESRPCVRTISDYVLEKTSKDTEFNLMMRKVLKDPKFKVGLIISERVINMPVETIPPMYKMLISELDNANESYDYYLVISKVYQLVAANEMEEDDQQTNKKKKTITKEVTEMDYFHYEDMVLEQNALYYGNYRYTNEGQETDSRRVFTEYGIDPRLSVILMDKKGLVKSVPEMEEKFPPF